MIPEKEELVLSVAECRLVRGIAIFGIVAHNYSHWMSGIVKENEFQWVRENIQALIGSVAWDTNLLFNLSSDLSLYIALNSV